VHQAPVSPPGSPLRVRLCSRRGFHVDCSLSPWRIGTDPRPVSEPEPRALKPQDSGSGRITPALGVLPAVQVGLGPRLLAPPPLWIFTIRARRALPHIALLQEGGTRASQWDSKQFEGLARLARQARGAPLGDGQEPCPPLRRARTGGTSAPRLRSAAGSNSRAWGYPWPNTG